MTALVLATRTQLRDHLNNQALPDAVADRAITSASSLIRAVARQDLDFVADDTITIEGGDRDLLLPQRPAVVDAQHPLTVVELDDMGNHGSTLTEGVHFRRLGDLLRKRYRSQWQPGLSALGGYAGRVQPWPLGIWAPLVRLTYSHGYVTCPEWLTTLALETATVYASNPQGLRSETVGQITLTWATEALQAPAALVDSVRGKLRAYGVLPSSGTFSIKAV